MSLKRKPTKQANYRPEGSVEITRMLRHEARVFKALENGISERMVPSPDVSPEKPVHVSHPPTDHRLLTGFESGYLGNSSNLSSMGRHSQVQSSVSGNQPLQRSRSFTSLHTLYEEPEGLFLQPNPVHNKTTPKKDNITSKLSVPKVSKHLGFDLRNLRLSFRKKKPNHQNPQPGYATCNYIDQVVDQPSSSLSFQNRCYFEEVNADCEKCKRLLKDPRFCRCSQLGRSTPVLPTQSNTSTRVPVQGENINSSSLETQVSYHNNPRQNHLNLNDSQKQRLQQSIDAFGVVRKRQKEASQWAESCLSQEEIRKSVARFSLAPNSEFSSLFNKNLSPESKVILRSTLKLDFIQNKWISDIAVTEKGEFVIADTKQVYVVDPKGCLKRNIGNKGNCLLKSPVSLCLNKAGHIVIIDKLLNNIQVFSAKGQHLRTVEDDSFTNLNNLTCHENDHVFVTNHQTSRISVHNEKNGVLLYHIPTVLHTSCQNQTSFTSPVSITTNPLTRDIVLGDDVKQSVITVTSLGQPKWVFKPSCKTPRPFFPNSLCADTNGYVFVSDLYNCNIYMLDSCGKCLRYFTSGDLGLRTGPSCIAVGSKGQLVVADEERTLKVFTYGNGGFTLQRRMSFCPA